MDKKETFRKVISVAVEILVFVGMFFLQFGTLGFTTTGLWASVGTLITTYIASLIIANNEYNNGVWRGKDTQKYKDATNTYNTKANLSGAKKLALPKFCSEYSKQLKEDYQRTVLEDMCISYERFADDYIVDGETFPAYKTLSKKELYAVLGKEKGKVAWSVKRYKVKEIKSSDILDRERAKNEKRIGATEDELKRSETVSNLIVFFIFAVFTSVFAVVGTHGLTLASFGMFVYQCSIIIMRSVTAHLKGYFNIVVKIVARMAQQGDYLDMFETWYVDNSK